MLRPSAAMLVLSILIAGCVNGDAEFTSGGNIPAEAERPEAGADSGSIAGRLIDEELNPVAGATVVLVETLNETKSDQTGRFTFNGLQPGSYTMVANKVGFKEAARQVRVNPAEITEIDVTLRALVVDVEWVQVYTFTRGVITGNYIAAAPNDVQTWGHNFGLEDSPLVLHDMLFEARWTPSTTLADGIRFFSGIDSFDSGKDLCVGTGHSPFNCLVAREALTQEWDCNPDSEDPECRAGWMFRPGGSSLLLEQAGAWPSEGVTVYTSMFYRAPMPEGYTGAGP